MDSVTVNLYEYCLGHGIAGWEISTAPHKIRVKDFSLNISEIEMPAGDTVNLQAIITPTNATDQDVTWRYTPVNRSSKLSRDGLTATFTSNKVKTYTITATLGDFQAECVVNVVDSTTGVEDIEATIDETSKSIQDGRILIKHGKHAYNVLGQHIR